MSNTKTKDLTAASSLAALDSLVGNVNADLTKTYIFPRALFDAVFASLLAGNTFQAQQQITQGIITTSKPFLLSQTWNAAGVTFAGLTINITDTASALGSLLADFQVGGTSKAAIDKRGFISLNPTDATGFSGAGEWILQTAFGAGLASFSGGVGHQNLGLVKSTNGTTGTSVCFFSSNDHSQVTIPIAYMYGWANGPTSAFADTAIGRSSAGLLEINNGTPATYAALILSDLIANQGNNVARIGHNGTNSITGIFINSASFVGFSSTTEANGAVDAAISRIGAGVLEVNDGTTSGNAQLNVPNCQSAQFLTPSGKIRIRDAGTIQQGTISTPSAPSAGNVFLYAKDVGGKVALMALFPTGGEQQIAIEP